MRDHYWIVAGDDSRPWSSAAALAAASFEAGYIDATDVEFQQRLTCDDERRPTRIASEAELRDIQIAVVPGLTMLSRLTVEEYTAIRQAEAASYGTVGRWLDALRTNGEVNLFGLTAEAAKQGLVDTGLLSAERAGVVFAP